MRVSTRVALIIALGLFTFVPRWQINFGPFQTEDDAREYLQTLWQVVAAAVGVSVALIAFVFEAFVSSAERRHGGTLREFSRQTHILWLFDLAAFSLLLDGLALAGVGHNAPAGWSGLVAAMASGLTLMVLLVAVPRIILRSLDPEQLTQMRLRTTRALAQRAVREQLIGQIVANELFAGKESGVGFGFLGLSKGVAIEARRAGVLHDVRRGTLLRALRGLGLNSDRPAEVVAEVERAIRRGSPLLVLPEPVGRLRQWRIRRAFRIRRRAEQLASTALEQALERLGQQIVGAVQRADETEWRALDSLLRDVLLELPRAVARLGLTFDGAVSRPGWFRRTPAERIFGIIDAAFQQALRDGSHDLAESILYSPYHVASEAQGLPAPGLVDDAAGFYLRAEYRVCQQEAIGASPALVSLRGEIVEVLFSVADRVGAHALAFDDEHVPVAEAQANLGRVLGSITALLRTAVDKRDESMVNNILMRLSRLTEHWDSWHDDPRGEAQREVLSELAVSRFAVASWALHLLSRSPERDRWAFWQGIATRLLDPLRSEQISNAYWRLAERERVFGSDYSFWFYDEDIGGVQSLDATAKAAVALVVALALRAEGGEQISFALEPDRGWRVQELVAAVEQVAGESERYAAVYGATLTRPGDEGSGRRRSSLERVRDALETAGLAAREQAAARTQAASLDPGLVTRFKAAAVRAVEAERLIKPLLKTRSRWRIVEAPEWSDRFLYSWHNKAFYTGEPGYIGQDTVATGMGRRAAMSELDDLVTLFENVRVESLGESVAEELGDAVEQMAAGAGAPPLIVCPVSWRLFEVLGVGFRGNEDEVAATGVPTAVAERFNGVFRGAPVVDYPSLRDRVLLIDLNSVWVEERPTLGGVGVAPDIRAFDEQAAIEFVREHPRALSDLPERDRVPWLRGHVRIEIAIAWHMSVEDSATARAFRVPDELVFER